MKISALYVDDEPALLDLGKLFLERTGYFSVETSLSAHEGLKKLSAQAFDVIISDYEMPEMNGIEFLQQVRSQFGRKPFILFTDRGREEIVINALNNGVDFYLQKGGEPAAQYAELAHKVRLAFQRYTSENALRDSDRQLAGIVNHLPDPTFAIDNQGKVIVWNRAIEELTGVRAGEMVGKGDHEYSIPLFGRRTPMVVDLILNPSLDMSGNFKYIEKQDELIIAEREGSFADGRKVHLWIKASPLYDHEGVKKGAIQTIREITEQKRSEQALFESQEKFSHIFQASPAPIFLIHIDTSTYFDVNDRFCELFGYLKEEVTGRSTSEIHIWADPRDHKVFFEDIHKKRIIRNLDARMRDRNGIIHDGLISADLIEIAGSRYVLILMVDISDQKRVEEELTRSEIKYQSIFESTNVGIFQTTPQGTYVTINPTFARMYGFDTPQQMKEEVQNIGATLYTNPHDREEFKHLLHEEGQIRGREFQFKKRDDTTFWGSVNAIAIRDNDDLISTYYGTVIDTTELREAREDLRESNEELYRFNEELLASEEELRQSMIEIAEQNCELEKSEERFRRIVETANEGIWSMDSKFMTTYVNQQMAINLGYAPEEMIGKNITDFMDPGEMADNLIRMNDRSTGKSGRYERKFIKKDGSPCWCQVSATPITDQGGEFAGSFAMLTDITDLKAIRETLTANELQYRSIFESANVGLFKSTPQGRYIAVNPTFSQMYGFETPEQMKDEIHNIGLQLYADPSERARVSQVLEDPGWIKNTEIMFLKKDFSTFWGSINAIGVRDGEGDVTAYYGTVIDVTEERIAREELAQRNEDLHQLNEELVRSEEEIRQNLEEISRQTDNLRESEERFRTVIEKTPIPMFISKNGSVLYTNDVFRDLTGYTADELKGLSVSLLAAPRLREVIRDRNRLREEKKPAPDSYNGFGIKKDGTEYPFHINISLLDLPDGPATLAYVTDLTRKHQEAEGLRARIALPKAAHAMNEEEIFRYCLNEAVQLTRSQDGFLFEMLPGGDSLKLITGSFLPGDMVYEYATPHYIRVSDVNILNECVKTGEVTICDGIYHTTSHRSKQETESSTGHMACIPIKPGDQTIFILGVGNKHGRYDDGDRLILNQLATDMELIIRQKRDEIQIRNANRNLSLLTSVIRHDVFNSLLALGGYLDLMEEDISDPDVKVLIQGAKSASEAIERKIVFTREYEKIGSCNPQWQSIEKTVRNLSTTPFQIRLSRAGFDIYADPMLVEVFDNFIDNSLRHGGSVSEVVISCQEEPDHLICIYEDNGTGISDGEKEKVFERGFGKNTGYGLFMIREILAITGMTITETGELGKGVRFEIIVPKGGYRKTDSHRSS
ncbi:MAG TPA: PAS domain S-box protein [Methanospirillum sp.]|nr:PAS domain S-box protein [Methanospirillum sp.]